MRDWREVLAPRFALDVHASVPTLFAWWARSGSPGVWAVLL